MYKNKTILAVIPARGGSKGIPKKNVIEINGKPLIEYTISEALNSKYIDRVIVSTDSQEIADVSMKCGADVPFIRPHTLAKDESKTIDVIIHLLSKLSYQNEKYDYLILLQPTQPLRKTFHIDEAITLMLDKEFQSLVSVNEVSESPVLMRTMSEENRLDRVINVNSTLRRQEFPHYYKVNGAIYINKIDDSLNLETSLNDNKYAYIMDKIYDLDIDEPFDLEILKLKLKNL